MTTEEYLRQLVSDWPPLTPEQRDGVRILMRTEPPRAPVAGRRAA